MIPPLWQRIKDWRYLNRGFISMALVLTVALVWGSFAWIGFFTVWGWLYE